MITLQFVRAPGLGSSLISAYERGWPSHVDAVLPDGRLLGARSDVLAGVPAGVQIRPADYEQVSETRRIILTADAQTQLKFWAFLQSKIGAPYDTQAIFAFPFNQDWGSPDSFICSGLQAAALAASGWFPRPLPLPHDMVTPWELLLCLTPWDRAPANSGS